MSESSTETTTESTEGTKVYTANVPGARDEDLRTIVLAHPLTKEQDFITLGLMESGVDLDVGIPTGGKVRVRTDHATSLIGAGYAAGVSPDKPKEVAAVVDDDKFAKDEQAAEEAVGDVPTEEQPAAAVVTDTAQAEAPAAPATATGADAAGSTGSTAPAAPATATSGDGAAAAKAASAGKAAGSGRG